LRWSARSWIERQAATGAREPDGVVYTPALPPFPEARNEAVAAFRLLLRRKSAPMLEPLKTRTDLLRYAQAP
jgi:hypothetical protein